MIITIANHKGGVCKTTIAVHLATWLARLGKRVVLIDLDTQGSVARFLGVSPYDDLAELIQSVLNLRADRRPPLTSFLTPVSGYENLVLVRGWGRSARLELELRQPGVQPPLEVLQEALAPLLSMPRCHVILDTGPYAGVLQEAALTIGDHVIVPGIPEAATEAGVLDIARRLNAVGRGITGVVPTKVITVAHEHKKTIEDWREALGPIVYYDPGEGLFGLIRRVIWGQLVRYGRTIWEVAPTHKGAREMEAVMGRIAYDAGIA